MALKQDDLFSNEKIPVGYSYELRGVSVQIRRNKKGVWQQRESKEVKAFCKWFGIQEPLIGFYGTRIILPDYRAPVLTLLSTDNIP